ncbi:hypothetical protein EZV62_007346 [Acer yangbiense]|uniref:NB-ARC domain-containing protein n=1 Tax=Acer yangbiense TaxID=1000413 RepID=A0A5C7IAG9_9ROSI|nr:hypothetical protein EZV62_007346 [Acer yangbiense]
MDSGTTEQHREDSGITEQRREDSGTTEKREDSGTTEQRREDSEITEQRREDSGTMEQRREDLGTMEKRKSHIFKLLKDDGVSTVVLVGDTGMGKTWMAREISECAVREGLCYESLWLSVTEKYDINLLYKSIAHQLSLSFITEEWEEEEEDIDSNRDVKDMKVEEELESLKHRIKAKLEDKKRSAALHEGKKYLLLVLDDEGNKMKDNDWQDIRAVLPSDDRIPVKILVTGRKSEEAPIIEGNVKEVTFEPVSFEGSLTILENSIDKKFRNIQGFEDLFDAIAQKSMGLPAAITVIAGALNYIARHSSGDWTLESALEKAAYYEEAAKGVNPLISCAYEMLPGTVIQNCFWHSVQFFRKHGGIHYNDLITHWVMEGNFDPFDHIEKAYKEGHCVLMELLDRGMLKIQDDNIVSMEGAALNIVDSRPQGYGGTANLGLASVFGNGEWKGLGRITQTDGMIKTLCNPKHWQKVSTLLIDGSCLPLESHDTFLDRIQELQVLAVFNPKFTSIISSFLKMDKLHVLLLRSCNLLEDMAHINKLRKLEVLEISGASQIKSLPEELFDRMTDLQSLNLSRLEIQTLPSLSNLKKLRLLILRRCSCLNKLPSLKELINLEILDLSGASSFVRFIDPTISFLSNIQMIDLSGTAIGRLPKFHRLQNLTRILLRDCCSIRMLPNLQHLPSLQILDLSGAITFNKFNYISMASLDDFRILDLSKTLISELPSIPSSLTELKLIGCSELLKLPCTTALKNLELLDVSNSSKLTEIEDESFQHLKYLHYLNLSNTKVVNLPSLSNLKNLRQLLLKDCSLLKNLPDLEELAGLEVLDISGCEKLDKFPNLNALKILEVLDLSGCSALEFEGNVSFEHMSRLRKLSLDRFGGEIAAQYLERMTHLQILKLSGIKEDMSSILSKLTTLTNLSQLSLKDCPGLKTLPPLEALSKLEVLDLSGEAVRSLPFLEKLSNLRELLLSGCSSLETLLSLKALIHLNVLDLSGTGIKEFPYEISELTCLKRLVLPHLNVMREVDWRKIKCLPEDVDWGRFVISKPNIETGASDRKPSILVEGTQFFHFLKENPELQEAWENPELQEACFKQISFYVRPPSEQANSGENFCYSDGVMFNNYGHFSHYRKDALALEIRGFNSFPTGLEDVLKHTEYISLTDNMFMKHLSDLDAVPLTKVKGCRLQACPKMEIVFSEERDFELGKNLEILWVSNIPNLKRLYGGEVQSVDFKNLTHLHLDCCPKLENVFPSSQFPENLAILQIKFCDSMKTVFEHKKPDECKLSKLHTLLLFELPELTSIGITLQALRKVKIRKCPKLDISEERLKSEEITNHQNE